MVRGNGELREALKILPTLDVLFTDKETGVVQYKMYKGTAISKCLFENDNITIARTEFSAGAILPSHVHDDIIEHILVETGHLELILCEQGEKIDLCSRQCYTIEPSVLHSAKILEDTVIIAISMPPDPNFPHPAC